MNYQRTGTSATIVIVMMTVLLAMAGGLALAANGAPVTPELAAKTESVHQQQQQRVSNEKRKSAAVALKAERLKIHQAKRALQPPAPVSTETK